eukprot:753821-Hanusia_phi.AAC.2
MLLLALLSMLNVICQANFKEKESLVKMKDMIRVGYPDHANLKLYQENVASEAHRTHFLEIVCIALPGPLSVSWRAEASSQAISPIESELMMLPRCSRFYLKQYLWLKNPGRVDLVSDVEYTLGGRAHQIKVTSPMVPLRPDGGWGSSPETLRPSDYFDGNPATPKVAQDHCPEEITLVTAAMDLMDEWEAPQRHWTVYADGLRRLLLLDCAAVVFVDSKIKDYISLDVKSKVQVEVLDREHLEDLSFFPRMQALRNSSWKGFQWNWGKVSESALYLSLVLLKPYLIARAARMAKSRSTTLLWIDSVPSCLHCMEDSALSTSWLHSLGMDGRIFATIYRGTSTLCRRKNADAEGGLPCKDLPAYTVKGSFFAMRAEQALWLEREYDNVMDEMLLRGFLLTEEYYLSAVTKRFPDKFVLYDRSNNPLEDDLECIPHCMLATKNPKPFFTFPPSGSQVHLDNCTLQWDVENKEDDILVFVGLRVLEDSLHDADHGAREWIEVRYTSARHMNFQLNPNTLYEAQVSVYPPYFASTATTKFRTLPREEYEYVSSDGFLDSRDQIIESWENGMKRRRGGLCAFVASRYMFDQTRQELLEGNALDLLAYCEEQESQIIWLQFAEAANILSQVDEIMLVHLDGTAAEEDEFARALETAYEKLEEGGLLMGDSSRDESSHVNVTEHVNVNLAPAARAVARFSG